jgi:hypothetical protein
MTEFRTIEIDFDIHKLIEGERRSFSESPNAVLRRLLKLSETSSDPAATTSPTQDATSTTFTSPTSGAVSDRIARSWSSNGVILPHGTQLKMEYNRRTYVGEVRDGFWHVQGKQFSSPSSAASGVALTKDGKLTSLDGWIYWHVKRPGDITWTAINQLRR